MTLILAAYGVFLAQKINLVTADLGRHLKNGELFVRQAVIPSTNLYSYTHPDHPFVNHHWGSGVVFYLVHQAAGFGGLSLFFIALSLAAFFLFFHAAWKSSSFEIASLISVFVLPVLASRIEIRPEVFSYFFCGLFLWMLLRHRSGALSGRRLYFFPFLILLWVNLHIYFFLGFVLTGAFFAESLVRRLQGREPWRRAKELGIVLVWMVPAALLNPNHVRGLLFPLNIFQSYGYRLFENQSVWFIERLMSYPPALYFKTLFGLLALSWIAVFVKKRNDYSLADLFLSVLFSALGWLAIRNFTLFGYFALPLAAMNFGKLFENGEKSVKAGSKRPDAAEKRRSWLRTLWLAAAVSAAMAFLFWTNPSYFSSRLKDMGVGLEKGCLPAAAFYLQHDIQGPVLNNYDNGGYLIYFLYPRQKVFVDNRPEAYPSEFFEKLYVPLQENDQVLREAERKFGFNSILFYRHDATPWGQDFLIRRVQDPRWAPVFVDDYSILFLRRGGPNQGVIDRYELPKEMFSVRKLK